MKKILMLIAVCVMLTGCGTEKSAPNEENGMIVEDIIVENTIVENVIH